MLNFRLLLRSICIYWRTIFLLIYPLILLPIFLLNNIPSHRCLYVVLIMAGFWVFEILPLPVTSLIPMVLFPLLGILDSDNTALCYLKETNMMFIGGLIIAIAVEHCNLHTRVALSVIKLVGCSPRRLNFGLVTVTMFVSMWISNTAATAMMIPIIEATLKELENQDIFEMFENPNGHNVVDDFENNGKQIELKTKDNGDQIQQQPLEQQQSPPSPPPPSSQQHEDNRRPTKTTMCYFYSTACAANIGGLGCIVGSGTNLTFKGIYESQFPDSPGVEFAKWMMLNVPMMLLMMYLSLIWLQVWFMGLFRPNSRDAKRIRIGQQGETVARKLIAQKINAMGPMSFHEYAVAAMFALSVMLWFFRKPQFIPGWTDPINDHFNLDQKKFKIKDATAALIVVLLLFILPARLDFLKMFNRQETKRPKQPSPALITWKVVQQKLPWGLIFLLGGGFALAEGAKASHMNDMIADYLKEFAQLPRFTIMVIATMFATLLTQFSSNVACANVLLPVLASISRKAQVHPMYLMMPTALACSFSFTLPVSTPPNAIAAAPCNLPSPKMAQAGIGVTLICIIILFIVFPTLGSVIWNFDVFPDWAN